MTIRLTILALLVALGALAGCSVVPGADLYANQGRAAAEDVADDLIDTAMWHLCYASSVGSIRREFGTSPERATLYYALCNTPGPVVLPMQENLGP